MFNGIKISIPKWSDFNLLSIVWNTFSTIQFQSQNGLILTNYTFKLEGLIKVISIPKWSDFNANFPQKNTIFLISIPKWSDFN